MKSCCKCKILKSFGEFYKSSRTKDKLQTSCKTCQKKVLNDKRKDKQWAKEFDKKHNSKRKSRTPEQRRENLLKVRFGITITDYERLLKLQNNKCAICETEKGDKSGRRLHVDHNHLTGEIRGLLCVKCNYAIGAFQDNPDILLKAIAYLNDKSIKIITKKNKKRNV